MAALDLAKVLVVAALPDEFKVQTPWHLAHVGIGKVRSAANLSALLLRLHKTGQWPSLVVNVGSAGSALLPRGTVAHCGQFSQHDFDLGPLAHLFPQQPPYNFDAPLAQLGLSAGKHHLHSGDQFLTTANQFEVVDMEGYALAAVCQAHGLPFAAFKYITDGTDDDSANDWVNTVKTVEGKLHQALLDWLQG